MRTSRACPYALRAARRASYQIIHAQEDSEDAHGEEEEEGPQDDHLAVCPPRDGQDAVLPETGQVRLQAAARSWALVSEASHELRRKQVAEQHHVGRTPTDRLRCGFGHCGGRCRRCSRCRCRHRCSHGRCSRRRCHGVHSRLNIRLRRSSRCGSLSGHRSRGRLRCGCNHGGGRRCRCCCCYRDRGCRRRHHRVHSRLDVRLGHRSSRSRLSGHLRLRGHWPPFAAHDPRLAGIDESVTNACFAPLLDEGVLMNGCGAVLETRANGLSMQRIMRSGGSDFLGGVSQSLAHWLVQSWRVRGSGDVHWDSLSLRCPLPPEACSHLQTFRPSCTACRTTSTCCLTTRSTRAASGSAR